MNDGIHAIVQALTSIGRPADAAEIAAEIAATIADKTPSWTWAAIEAAADEGLVVKICGHRHIFTTQPMDCLVPAYRSGPVCQCRRGREYLQGRSNSAEIYRVEVYMLAAEMKP